MLPQKIALDTLSRIVVDFPRPNQLTGSLAEALSISGLYKALSSQLYPIATLFLAITVSKAV